ncbi:MAG TPA: hypothetical protein VF494_08355 [Candidatus Limnocylindrales bacterium]
MIRNVVLHLMNEQPLLADLFEAPSAGDVGLRCTNLRTMNLKRPVFVDDSASTFFFPYLNVRFVEIPAGAITGTDPGTALQLTGSVPARDERAAPAPPADEAEPDLEIDEDFLRRIREV